MPRTAEALVNFEFQLTKAPGGVRVGWRIAGSAVVLAGGLNQDLRR